MAYASRLAPLAAIGGALASHGWGDSLARGTPATIAKESFAVTAPAIARVRETSACAAPSLARLHAKDDARDESALAQCSWSDPYLMMCDREQPVSPRCGLAPFERAVDMQRLLDAAVPLDGATRAHVRSVFEAGRALGRRADAVGIVGDSMSVDRAFLKPFADPDNPFVTLSPAVKDALAVDADRTILDVFRASFDAPRAARVGAKAGWARTTDAHGASPLSRMIDEVSPAFAVVMYGTNDAVDAIEPASRIAARFGAELGAIVDALEAAGVVPILSTIPKHMRDRRFADCPVKGTDKSNLRYAIQTNAVSAAAADMACTRHLPLLDLRYALDPLLDHGVGKDGVHPTRFYRGGGILDERGLQCGYNVKNFVTLRMLKQVRDAVIDR